MRFKRRTPNPETGPELGMSVGDLVQQLDALVDRLQTETSRLEVANTHAETVIRERSNP